MWEVQPPKMFLLAAVVPDPVRSGVVADWWRPVTWSKSSDRLGCGRPARCGRWTSRPRQAPDSSSRLLRMSTAAAAAASAVCRLRGDPPQSLPGPAAMLDLCWRDRGPGRVTAALGALIGRRRGGRGGGCPWSESSQTVVERNAVVEAK